MNTYRISPRRASTWLLAAAILALLLSACVAEAALIPTSLPTEEPQPQASQTPAPPTPVNIENIRLDLTGLAQDLTVETVAAVPPSPDGPWWAAMPQYRQVTLRGYPVMDHKMRPQIFIYPVEHLTLFNEIAGQTADGLQGLLQSEQIVSRIPFLPLINAAQVLDTQARFLDFQNGEGVRFLTQFNQFVQPVNNEELIYSFQGITSTGKYYVAAVLPVTHPELPDTPEPNEQQLVELQNFDAYRARIVGWLNEQPGDSFVPSLDTLDALIQSIEVMD